MPEWPPKNYDYLPTLQASRLKRVEVNRWKMEPDIDE